MKRIAFFAYGLACYLMFLGVFAYLAAFLANILVFKSIDTGEAGWPIRAVIIDTALLVAFGLQHSIMARPTFKRWWTRLIPEPVERSTYVLLTNLCLIALFAYWQPINFVLWEVAHPLGAALLWILFALGWAIIFIATLLLNHFDLFGLRQVWLFLRGRPYTPLKFQTPLLYRWVRHPLYVGWMVAFWVTPVMTLGHMLFASVLTAYMLAAIQFEERNLVQFHGRDYEEYRRRTPMLVPLWRRWPRPLALRLNGRSLERALGQSRGRGSAGQATLAAHGHALAQVPGPQGHARLVPGRDGGPPSP